MMVTEEIVPGVPRASPEPGPSTRDVVPGRGHHRPREAPGGRRCRILLVDNSPILIRAIEAMLAPSDWIDVIGSASSGGAALERIEQLEPDIVLLDLALPGMGGLEVIGRLAEQGRRPVVIMMTTHVDEDYRRAAAAGADGFLIKADLWTDLLPLIVALRSPPGGDAGAADGRSWGARPTHPTGRVAAARPVDGDRGRRAPHRGKVTPKAILRIMEPPMSQTTSIGRSVLTGQIRQLCATLERIRNQEAVAEGSEFPSVQADDDYLYLEVEVPGHGDLEVDISIWDGRAFIRVGR